MKRNSLEQQCIDLNLPLEHLVLDYDGRPEPALLKYYESQGYVGSYIEGYTLFTVIKALMLDCLVALFNNQDRERVCVTYLESMLLKNKDSVHSLVSCIDRISESEFISNVKEILHQPFIKTEYPSLNMGCCIALFDAIDKETFKKVALKISEDPYAYRKGWPDLTIVKDDHVRFIEVKTTDKLTKSQLITIPAFKEAASLDFSVCKVAKPET